MAQKIKTLARNSKLGDDGAVTSSGAKLARSRGLAHAGIPNRRHAGREKEPWDPHFSVRAPCAVLSSLSERSDPQDQPKPEPVTVKVPILARKKAGKRQ